MPVYLLSYANRMLYSEHTTFVLARRYLNTMILTNFENLNSISNIFQETHDFFVLADPVIICIYLGITERHFCDHGNVRYLTSVTKMRFGPKIKYLSEPFSVDFCCREGISCSRLLKISFPGT